MWQASGPVGVGNFQTRAEEMGQEHGARDLAEVGMGGCGGRCCRVCVWESGELG